MDAEEQPLKVKDLPIGYIVRIGACPCLWVAAGALPDIAGIWHFKLWKRSHVSNQCTKVHNDVTFFDKDTCLGDTARSYYRQIRTDISGLFRRAA